MRISLLFILSALMLKVNGQSGWKVCHTPPFTSRADDIFMLNAKTGYAVTGDGLIMKTTDSGDNWNTLVNDNTVYCRSVEFINEQKGFVGGFPRTGNNKILRSTIDGGNSWTDLTASIHPKARNGICGLAAPDANTIYGCGNWYMDSAYIIKSTDGGTSWSFIDMGAQASSLIDFYFFNKDTGFVAGKGPKPLEQAVILYTTNGGTSWSTVYTGGVRVNEYCWKLNRLNENIFFASIQSGSGTAGYILRSVDKGQNWNLITVTTTPYFIQGTGFMSPLKGWAGGGTGNSYETSDGGKTWTSIAVCPSMNRVVKVNDTLLFATGAQIWKYSARGTYPNVAAERFVSLKCVPNPVRKLLTVYVGLVQTTRLLVTLLDESGRRIATLNNSNRDAGSYQYTYDVSGLPAGIYFVSAMTHEDREVQRILVSR